MTQYIPAPRNLLVSYHYYKDYDLSRFAHCRVIGDSGAFSAANAGAVITTAEVAGWAKKWPDVLTWVAALDVIGDSVGTQRNWHEMVDIYGVDGVPTIHYGCDPGLMDYYAERGVDFVGLGGMVGRPIPQQLRWLVACFRHARDRWPQMRFHGWGVTAPKLLQLPFYSVDSSGWSATYRYGRLALRDPQTGKSVAVPLDGRSVYSPEVVAVLRFYGVTPSQIATSGPHNRRLLVRLSALSASVAEQQFRKLHRRHPVTAPVWVIRRPDPASPHSHLAASASGKEYGEDIADLAADGPHQHLAVGSGWQQSTASWDRDAVLKGHYEDVVLTELAGAPGPHSHLALNAKGQEYENDAVAELAAAPGPHIHLVEGSAEHLGIVAGMAAGTEE